MEIYKPKNDLIIESLELLSREYPHLVFTGRVSFEAYGVIKPSDKDPHDIDVLSDKFLDDSTGILTPCTIAKSDPQDVSDILALPNHVALDVYKPCHDMEVKKFNVSKRLLVLNKKSYIDEWQITGSIVANFHIKIAHPRYAAKAKLKYIASDLLRLHNSNARKRVWKHGKHLVAYLFWEMT